MRLRRLAMERYGVYARREVAFADGGLTVVYGPNEAGKSTCLAAVGDLLFGIPHNSTHGQVFGYDGMRLEATLGLADGGTMTVRRRKGRGRTLVDAEGRPLDDAVLAPLLGATTRERFHALFGLDHASLRQGGRELLGAQGDIGRLILEAGGGLRALVDRIAALDAEADRLYAPRRADHRAFYRALDAFAEADREIRERQVTREDFHRAESAAEAARGRADALRLRRTELAVERAGLERLARVIPLLRELDRLATELGRFGALPQAPAGEAAAIRAAIGERERAARALRDATEAHAALAARTAAVTVADDLIAAEAAIETLKARATEVAAARRGRPNRDRELDDAQARLDALRRRIGVDRDVDLAPLVPARAAPEALQRLIAEGDRLRTQIDGLDGALAGRASVVAGHEARLHALAQAGHDRPLGFAAADFTGLAAAARAAEARRQRLRTADAALAARVAALGFDSSAALRLLPCPDRGQIDVEIARRAALAALADRHAAEARAATQRRARAADAISRLRQGGEVASDAAIAGARAAREAAWEPIRAAFLGERTLPAPAGAGIEAAVFEARIADADGLADRRAGEAQRVADLAGAECQAAEATVDLDAASQALAAVQRQAEAEASAWRAAWPEVCLRHDDPGRLKAFAAERQEILSLAEAQAAERRDADAAGADVEPAIERLAHAEAFFAIAAEPERSLAARVAAVSARIQQHEKEHAEHRALTTTLTALAADQRRDTDARQRLAGRLEDWSTDRRAAVLALGLDPAIADAHALEVANLWLEATGNIEALKLAERRLQRMDDDEGELARLRAGIAEAVALPLPEDAVAAANLLSQHLGRARDAAVQRETLAAQLAEAGAAEAAKARALAEVEAGLERLARRHGCATGDLSARADALDAAAGLLRERHGRMEALAAAGDGEDEPGLRARWAGRDLDRVTAELEQVRATATALEADWEEVLAHRQAAEAAEAALGSEAGINAAVARREAATADLRSVGERYVEVAMARALLQAAVERIRAENQDPLILRAGALLARATTDAFAGVDADVDERGNPVVVGRRAGGDRVPVEAMSDGTRDQLFLAFRIASVERYCRAAEPLPFVADDLLVHFDDDRSAATLAMLAELGRTTQVLLFTHHRAVADAARRLGGDAVTVTTLA
ncbi:MAG: AAA family ATPase [Alphaproteobacteria bacterium]|nr:AAA family ATPase [Alphaproteobacteria bacterium]